MRQPLGTLLAATVLLVTCVSARAGASASVLFTGPGAFNINQGTTADYEPADGEGVHGFTLETSGALFTMANVSVPLRRGESADFFYDYTIALHDDGLAADRTWGFCAPISGNVCAPVSSGNERASVTFVAGFVDNRISRPYLNVTGESIHLATDGGSFADGVTQGGRLHVHVEASAHPAAPALMTADFSVYALAAVDASPLSPIPEPATYALILAGLGVLGLKARRRRR